jgi:hypothetical protein
MCFVLITAGEFRHRGNAAVPERLAGHDPSSGNFVATVAGRLREEIAEATGQRQGLAVRL